MITGPSSLLLCDVFQWSSTPSEDLAYLVLMLQLVILLNQDPKKGGTNEVKKWNATPTACRPDTNKDLVLTAETSCLSGFVAASAPMQWPVWRRNGALLKDICWVWVWMLQNKPWRTGMRVCTLAAAMTNRVSGTQPFGNRQRMPQCLGQIHVGELASAGLPV